MSIPLHHLAGKPPAISFDAPPADAPCAGKFLLNGKPYGTCNRCPRPRAEGIFPAATLRQGEAHCINEPVDASEAGVAVHAKSVGANPDAAQTAKQGAPIGVSPSPSAQKERA